MTGSSPGCRSDAEAVAALLGRPSLTAWRVAVRCPHGGPAVLENDPVDLRGRPFPTRYWLACRALGDAVSRLEAAGGVKALEAREDLRGALADQHRRHAARHGGTNVAGTRDPARVKCLHAHLAAGLAMGGGPVTDWIMAESGAAWPARCCVEAVCGAG
jgi:hypothetical protein